MVRKSKSPPRPVVRSTEAETASPALTTASEPKQTPEAYSLKLKHYLLMNVGFIVFCAIQLIIVTSTLPDSQGVFFFFALLAVAFFVVSFTDYWLGQSNRKGVV